MSQDPRQGSVTKAVGIIQQTEPTNLAFYTVTEAAKLMGVDRGTLTIAINSGDIQVIRVGKRIVIPKDSLQPKPRQLEYDPIIAEMMHYHSLLRQRNALDLDIARTEANLMAHCDDQEWKKIAGCTAIAS